MNSLLSTPLRTFLLLLAIAFVIGLGYAIRLRTNSSENGVATPNSAPNETVTIPIKLISSNVEVDQPIVDETITSPVIINGKARGTWFFEASFPIKVLDANGKLLGHGIATAEGDWMTTEFVPFSAKISFDAATTSSGTIVLIKDNPSGLPEHDDAVSLTVKFY